jgi:isocitrate dehydrogenase kinase/phosphatase
MAQKEAAAPSGAGWLAVNLKSLVRQDRIPENCGMSTSQSGLAKSRVLEATQAILSGFDAYQDQFKRITRRARGRFESQDWHSMQADALQRLDLYKTIVDKIVPQVEGLLGEQSRQLDAWVELKAAYSLGLHRHQNEMELAQTFFNSISRRILITIGVNPLIEFLGDEFKPGSDSARPPVYSTHPYQENLQSVLVQILSAHPFAIAYQDLGRDIRQIRHIIQEHLERDWGSAQFDRIEMLRSVFYRGTGAFLIGRICRFSGHNPIPDFTMTPEMVASLRQQYMPLLLCLQNRKGKIAVDAVLLDEDEASVVFSFTRSYFHVEAERPAEVVRFLKSIIPLKRIAELYNAIGFNKHGKTELYRDLMRHLEHSSDQFEIAPGERGMVMVVFTLPSYDMVFKVIKDHLIPPKSASRAEVMQRYDLVFKHDRAGRLVEAQEFEHLSFSKERFTPQLLDELLQEAPGMISIQNGLVSIQHLYIERRTIPLNLYFKNLNKIATRQVVLDYGKTIKDLAATNIFPGDILLKNFGLTRHGRVVFYDYDELCLLTDCQFRYLPQAHNIDDEFSADPWFYVGPNDIFPEEFRTFLGLQGPLRSVFMEAHSDLFEVAYWRAMQQHHLAGEVVDILPYPENRRLPNAG